MKLTYYIFICIALLVGAVSADDWPQWRGPTADGVWHERGIVTKLPPGQLPLKWRVNLGSGYTGPTVAAGRVYVMDRQTEGEQTERVLCFNAENGQPIWNHSYPCEYRRLSYPAGPRACVTIHQGRAYALGAMGHMYCLDAATGSVLWQRDLNRDYKVKLPIWGISGSPLIVDDLVILHIGGRPEACVVALDKGTGVERWTALSDRAQYTSPILLNQAGQDVVAVWTGDAVQGLNPTNGDSFWTVPFKPKNMPIGVATPVWSGDKLFCTSFYDGSLLLQLDQKTPTVKTLWKRVGASERNTEALHSIISTPIILDKHIYGVDSYGELRCLDLETGERIWEDLRAVPKARWSTIHFVRNGSRIWMFNERGELIIARLSPQGYHEISRAQLIEPTTQQLNKRGGVCWSHPAYANRCVYARNDRAMVCADLSQP